MKRSTDLPEAAAESLDWLSDWGFEFDDADRWIDRLREAESMSSLGRIGPYELEREVSRGGQGVVFRARQPGTHRSIALKRMLAGSFATEAMRRRFEREVEAAALLNHPGIVTVYGMEVVDDVPLCAMEWIDGVSVTEWAEGRDPEEILELFLRICDAVQHAHSRGVLHRDLKPSNILVDAGGQPHVLDFGLAKRAPFEESLGEDGVGAELISKSAESFGTPAYAAPEQLSGTETHLDARADVYALGVLLFEMLTGESPYGSWDSVPELLRRVGTVRAPRPSSLDPRLGSDLDVVVLEALDPDRAQRYSSVEALGADVRRYLAGDPVQAVAPSSWTLFRRLVSRNRVASAFVATVALLLGMLGIQAQLNANRLEREKLEAEEARDAARERADRLAALLAFVPDCVHVTDDVLSAYVAKPGTLLDQATSFSSPNPHYDPEAAHEAALPVPTAQE